MASEFTVSTGKVVPENKGGPTVGLGGRCLAKRDSDGSIGLQLNRGDGQLVEAYTFTVRTIVFGPFAAGVEVPLEIGSRDLHIPDFIPRGYELRVVAIGGATLKVRKAVLVTEPSTDPGLGDSPPPP